MTVLDSRGLDAWVYLDHVVYDRVARDAAGDLVFQLPDLVGERAVVEVLLRRPRRSGGA